MKERYFTPESIDHRAKALLEQVRVNDLRKRRRPQSARERSALLVLDMQRYFVERESHAFVPSAEAIIPRIRRLVSAYSEQGLPVIFTRHLNTPRDAGRMAVWWRDLINRDDRSSELVLDLPPRVGIIIEKSQYDAFYRTSLEEILKERGVEQLVICGLMTHLCCETTARAAFVRGFEVLFPVDGTATYNEEFHRATLLTLTHGFADPLLVKEILTLLGSEDVA